MTNETLLIILSIIAGTTAALGTLVSFWLRRLSGLAAPRQFDRAQIDDTFNAEIDSLNAQLAAAGDDEERAALSQDIKRVRQQQRQFYRASRELLLSKSLRQRLTPPGRISAEDEPSLRESDRQLLETAAAVVARLEPPTTFAEHLLQGDAFYAAEDFEKALSAYNRALELQPDDPTTLNNRGAAFRYLDRYDEALADYSRLVELTLDDPDALINRGNILHLLHRHEDALASFNRALQVRPRDAHAVTHLGMTLHDAGHHQEALDQFQRAIELNPSFDHAFVCRAFLLLQLQHYDEALADFNRSLEIRPADPETLSNRGITLAYLQRNDEALADIGRALELKPGYPTTLYNRACAFSVMRRLRESLEQLKEAISRDEKYRKMAREDQDFDNLRSDPTLGPEFERLVAEPED